MHQPYSDQQLRFAARLYYIDGVSQNEVAKLVRVSQAKVSRLLTVARERGIVRISVEEYETRNEKLEAELRSVFGLTSAAVIKTSNNATGEVARKTVGHLGAPFVASLLPASGIVTIAGGRTVKEIAARLPERAGRRITVVQAMGSIDSNISDFDAIELGRSLVQRWGCSFLTLTTPAFVPDRRTRDSFLAFPQIRSVWQKFAEASAALVGIGTLADSAFVERKVLTTADIEGLRRCGAVGEICGRFFDRNGRECDSPWQDRVISIDLNTLRKIPQVIGVVTGSDRSEAIAAAARSGLLNTLVIDEAGATALLAKDLAPRKTKTRKVKPR